MIDAWAGTFPGAGHVKDGHAGMGNPRGHVMGIRSYRQIYDAIGLVKTPSCVDRQGRAAPGAVACQD